MKMKKCTILVPTRFNDGSVVPPSVLIGIIREFNREFGGYSTDGLVAGAYRMADGSMAYDTSIRLWVVLAPDRVETVRNMAGRIAALLKQESLYFEVEETDVEFVPPSHGGTRT
jgi:hypothetical protein